MGGLLSTVRSACLSFRVALIIGAIWAGQSSQSQDLRITGIDLAGGKTRITHTASTNSYFVLQRGNVITDVSVARDVRLGVGTVGELVDSTPLSARSFFRVVQVPLQQPLDLDRDGIDDVYELQHSPNLNPLDPADAISDSDGDLRSNLLEYLRGTDPVSADFFVVTSPANGETGVSVNREAVFRFTVPLAADTSLTGSQMWAEAAGRKLLTRVELGADLRSASLFYMEPVPPSTRVRVNFDGTGIRDAGGRELDLDSNGTPGGLAAIEYTTASANAVPGTAVIGHIYASEPVPDPSNPGAFTNRPLAGVTITVDGQEEILRTVTLSDGSFSLDPSPSGRFFVNVDGRTSPSSTWPNGPYYPLLGKAWEAVPGVKTNLAGGTGLIYLPLVAPGTLQPISANAPTPITFPSSVTAANPDLVGVEITVPPNGLFSDTGNRGGMVGLAPVASDRLPEPLPPGLNHAIDISIQTSGPQNFTQPVPAKFPNLPDPVTGKKLPPGSKTALWSFNHDTGIWEMQGSMTITADGNFAVTDPGVGIRQPGWHGTSPGTSAGGPPPGKAPPPRRPNNPPPPGNGFPGIPVLPCVGCPPPPPPPPAPDGSDDGEGSPIPDFPDLPDIPGVNVPHSWGDLVSTVVGELPTMGPDVFGPIVDIGKEGIDMFDDLGDVIGSHGVTDSDGDGVPDVVESQQEFLQSIEDAADDFIPGPPEDADDAADTLKEWWDIWQELYGDRQSMRGLRGLAASPNLPAAAIPHLEELIREQADLDRLTSLQKAFDDFYVALLGSRWTALANIGVQFRELLPVLNKISAFQQAGTDGGVNITPGESASVLALDASKISADFRQQVINRFNLTVSNYAAHIVLQNEAPANNQDFVDAGALRTALRTLLDQIQIEADAGFVAPVDRSRQLATRLGPALGGFFGAFLPKTPLQPSAQNEYLVLLEIFPNNGGSQLQRLKTDSRGQLNNLRVPADAIVIVRWLDPQTFQTAASYFVSGASGSTAQIPQAVWNDQVDTVDTDHDGLPDSAEFIVGTSANNPDTDGDGVADAAEVHAGTNPLDGIVIQPGIIAVADTPGNAVDVAVETYDLSRFGGPRVITRILVADGSAGVAIMELVNGQPVRLGQVDTPGDAQRVALPAAGELLAEELSLGAAADGSAGLAIINFADPVKPVVLFQIPLGASARSVTIFDGLAYVGAENGDLTAVDLLTGTPLSTLRLSFSIHDLKVSSGVLYAVGPRAAKMSLQAIPLLSNGLPGVPGTVVEAAATLTQRGFRLSVGDGLAYAVHGRGYNTWNLTDQLNPVLIAAGQTAQFGWQQLSPDGTGLGIASVGGAASDDGAHDVTIYDIRDPAQTERFVNTIVTPGLAYSAVVHDGKAFVADGAAGLELINYLAPERDPSQPPSAELSLLPTGPVVAGSRFTALVKVTDNVQVRFVDLLVNGTVQNTDRTWPFEFSLYAPLLTSASNMTVQARVTDGAGNVALSTLLEVALVPDTIPPQLVSVNPPEGRVVAGAFGTVAVSFNEPMNIATLSPGIQLLSAGVDGQFGTPDDLTVTSANLGYAERSDSALLQFSSGLSAGRYRINVAPTVSDRSSNLLGTAFSSEFRVAFVDLRTGGTFLAEGTLPAERVQDQYAFLANAGQDVFFDLQAGVSLGFRWSLVHESGQKIFDVVAIGDHETVTLPLAGRYILTLLRTGPMDENGHYKAQIYTVPTPQVFDIAIGDIVSDQKPAAGAGRIETPASEDKYRFSATAGQRVFFDIQAGIAVGLAWRLEDPNGTKLFDGAFIGDAGVFTLTNGGVYTLTLGNRRSDFVGAYQFQLWNVPAPQAFNIAVDDVVSDGQPAAGAGRIESPGTEDVYTFSATPGQQVFFDIQAGIAVGLAWRLEDATGTRLFDGAFIGDAGTVTLTNGGVYTLTLGNRRSDYSGPYQFKMWNVPIPQAFNMVVGDIVSDDQPAAGAGRIESPGAEDVYTFTATAGQQVYFDIQAGLAVGLAWRLVDPNGVELFDRAFISDAGVVTLTNAGPYTLTLGNRRSDFVGTYKIQLWNVPFAQGFNISIGDTVRDGQPAVGAGRIESPGVEDIYTFSAAAGQFLSFDLQAGASAGLAWKLIDPSGTIVFDRGFIGDSGPVTAPSSGLYTLVLGNRNSDFTGTYQFQITSPP